MLQKRQPSNDCILRLTFGLVDRETLLTAIATHALGLHHILMFFCYFLSQDDDRNLIRVNEYSAMRYGQGQNLVLRTSRGY